MDTNVLPKEPLSHHEHSEAQRKQDKLDARAEANAGFGATTGGMRITNLYHAKVTDGVKAKLSGPKARSGSNDFKLEQRLRQLSPEVVALCLLQSGLHMAATQVTERDALENIGAALNTELWAHKLLQTNKQLAHRINKTVKERYGSVQLRLQMAKRIAEKGDTKGNAFVMKDWTRTMLVHAGQWGVNILLETMPDVFEMTEPEGFKQERLWIITEKGLEKAKAATDEAVAKSPVYQPRTERPADWSQFVMRVAEDDRTLDRAQLLRTRHKDIISAARHAMTSGQMAPALTGINTLQSVPFMINTWIMDVLIDCFDKGIHVDGLPDRQGLEVPPKLPKEEFTALSVEERRYYAKNRRGRIKANRANDADIMQLQEDMRVAARQSVVERFYTPMNMDWRTRVYSLTHFNFQREDRVRALFLFANGEPIGKDGIYWLKLHVANCGDFDKCSKKPMDERIKWVDDNLTVLADYVKRPLYNTGWTKADAPFLFLAACRELTSALDVGPSYVSHLPVSWDGACNGLQHLAAMTRAPEGRYVNLTTDPVPHDVYQLVADIAKQMIEADLGNQELFGRAPSDDEKKANRKTQATYNKLAKLALAHGVDRKLVKRNVMTFAYSSKEFGMGEQHYEDTMEPLELKMLKGEIEEHPFGETEDEWRLASRYLAKRVLAAIKQVVGLPAEAMAFMQKLAQALAHEGKPLRWITPAGVPCINRYHESTTERIELFAYDKGVKVRRQITLATGFDTPIAKDKAAAGIAPNFVHSHDAAHLLLTVTACAEEGITDIATVHDSFGCLPSRAGRFNQIIRETFLRMYQDHDVLAELLESARADLTPANHHKLPELPAKGALDLKEIINARYAFA